MRFPVAVAVLSLIAWLPAFEAAAVTITLNGGGTSSLSSAHKNGPGPSPTTTVNPTAFPYAETVHIGPSDQSETYTTYDLSYDGFDLAFDHQRAFGTSTLSHSYGELFFSFDEDVPYDMSGSYAALDPDGIRVFLQVSLHDLTTDTSVFYSYQESRETVNESFVVGLSEGDYANTDTGSLTGTLLAGHEYHFSHTALIQAFPTVATQSATATGGVFLDFDVVPEPHTGLLVSLGLIGLAARRKGQHRS